MKVLAALAALAVLVPASPAHAGGRAVAHCGREGCASLARSEQAGGVRRRWGRSGTCTYRAPIAVPANMTVYRVDGSPIRPEPGEGRWMERDCRRPDGSLSVAPVFVRPRLPAPAAMAVEARGYLAPGAPGVRLNPTGLQIVNFPTWLWVDPAHWQPITSTVEAGGVAVTVVATPVRGRWAMGDGAVVTCEGPGRPWAPSAGATDCSHTYRRASVGEPGDAYRLVLTIDYVVAWSAVGAPGGGALTPLSIASPPVPVRVGEVQALGTPRRH